MPAAARPGPGARRGRHRLVAGFALAYLAAGGITLALGDRVGGSLPGRLGGTVWFYVAVAARPGRGQAGLGQQPQHLGV